jgi:hypothetical protein
VLVRTPAEDGRVEVEMPDAATSATPFDDFVGSFEIDSNDVAFRTDDPNTTIDVASRKLRLVSDRRLSGFDPDAETFAIRDEEDPERPIVRIRQVADPVDARLPRLDQYSVRQLQQNPITFEIEEVVVSRENLEDLDIQIERTAPGQALTFGEILRDRVTTANLQLVSAGDVVIDVTSAIPGFEEIDVPDVLLASLDIRTLDGLGTITIEPFEPGSPDTPLRLGTEGDQRYGGAVVLAGSLAGEGRDIAFAGDVSASDADAGLALFVSRDARFEGDVGASPGPLARLAVLFDRDASGTPNVQFGRRLDDDDDNGIDDAIDLAADPGLEEIGDEVAETPIPSDQEVRARDGILVGAIDGSDYAPFVRGEITEAELDLGRDRSALFATLGKALGDLTLQVTQGDFEMGAGERLSVGGTARVEVGAGRVARLGSVSALALEVVADEIELVRAQSGVYLDRTGETRGDAGPAISVNSLDFAGTVPRIVGAGRTPYFGFPDPFSPAIAPGNPEVERALGRFATFALKPGGGELAASEFVFRTSDESLVAQVPFLPPTGASRSDLSGASGPIEQPTPSRRAPEPIELARAERLRELDVEPVPTPPAVSIARLRGAAVIDDLGLATDGGLIRVTEGRLVAADAEAAIDLYERIFGPDGERAAEVRATLQDALDLYLETTRARRVYGFELRRFVKNRPVTLIQAYETLDELDRLFRYHRRLGLTPGEYRAIQLDWLRQIQPEGITLDELSEAIHPSRYVRGSDILDIFGE